MARARKFIVSQIAGALLIVVVVGTCFDTEPRKFLSIFAFLLRNDGTCRIDTISVPDCNLIAI